MFENDVTLNGKHATYLKFLAVKNSKEDKAGASSAGIFERYIDVYMNAAVWGLLYQRKADKDGESSDRARIYADAFAKERKNCVFLYRLVMLLDDTTQISDEERINKAFRYDTQSDKKDELEKNLELFNSYVRGGIELLYEQFTDGCTTKDDYIDKTFEIMKTFKNEIENKGFYEDEILNILS